MTGRQLSFPCAERAWAEALRFINAKNAIVLVPMVLSAIHPDHPLLGVDFVAFGLVASANMSMTDGLADRAHFLFFFLKGERR